MATTDVDIEGLSDVEVTMDFTDFRSPSDFSKALKEFFDNARDCDRLGDHTALVNKFPPKLFAIEYELSLLPKRRRIVYFQERQLLFVKMLGIPHEIAARGFGTCLERKLGEMGCDEDIVQIGGATMLVGSVRKEADASWGPFNPGSGSSYSTCVVECGLSKTSRTLTRDARIWLESENSKVAHVITIKIYRRPEIILKVWTRAQQDRNTRAHHPPRAVMEQEIRITLLAGRPVVEGKLSLSFEKILERRPRPGTAEGDLKFTARELGGVARRVWSDMGFDIE